MVLAKSDVTIRHSHQELALEKLNTRIVTQEDKLAELRYALSTLAGGENHAAYNQLKKSIDEFEDTITQLRNSVVKLGGTPPPVREQKGRVNETKKSNERDGKSFNTIDHANEVERKRRLQQRTQKNKRFDTER